MLTYAMVNALVMPAEYDYIVKKRHRVSHVLRQNLSVGRSIDDFIVVPLGFQSRETSVDRLNLHDHASFSSKRIVIDLAMPVGCVITQIMHMKLNQSLLRGTLHDRTREWRFKHFR